MIAQYIVTRPMYGICAETKRMQISSAPMHWWEQVVIDMEVSLKTSTEKYEGGGRGRVGRRYGGI